MTVETITVEVTKSKNLAYGWGEGGWMICWTPADPTWGRSLNTHGQMALVRWPDLTWQSQIYAQSDGACFRAVHDFTETERRAFVLSIAMGAIIRHGLKPEVVHRALWPLKDYRCALPPDTQGPDGEINDDGGMPLVW